jgi:hypothetical protein
MGKIVTQFDLFRNCGQALQGHEGWPWNYAGGCLTAQSAVFHPQAFDGLEVVFAQWRICWHPNVPEPAQTAVRLISADDGPSEIQEIAATYSGGKVTPTLDTFNEGFNITDKVRALVDSHRGTGKRFQLIHQSMGDGMHGCLIFSSSIELVFET